MKMPRLVSSRSVLKHPPLRFAPLAAISTFGLLAGCASEPSSHVVSAPPPLPPAMVTTPATPVANPGYTTSPSAPVVVVTQAPPAPQQEVVLTQPTPQHVWIAGYWRWRASTSRYEWVAGHWEVPPRPGAVWVPPRLEQEGNAYRFHEGYWH